MTTLTTGDKAPTFQAMDQHGLAVKLADFSGGKLFIYFFPKANTSG